VMLGGLISALVCLPLALPFHATGKDVALLAFLGIFQLGLPGSLSQQYVAVKFGGLVVKGAGYAHYQVLVDR